MKKIAFAVFLLMICSCKKDEVKPIPEPPKEPGVENVWTAKSTLPGSQGRSFTSTRPGYCVVDSKIYMTYGNWNLYGTSPCSVEGLGCAELSKIWVYDPSINEWNVETQIPDTTVLDGTSSHHAILKSFFCKDKKFYCVIAVGTMWHSSVAYTTWYLVKVYDLTTKKWTDAYQWNSGFPDSYSNFSKLQSAPIYYNGEVYVFLDGGHNLAKFNFTTYQFESIGVGYPSNTQYAKVSTFVIGDKLYVVGGSENELAELDLITLAWTKKSDFPAPPRYATVAFSLYGKGYVGLGTVNPISTEYSPVNDLYEYDPKTNTWTQKMSLPEGRLNPLCCVIGNKAYIGGGQGPTGMVQDMYEYK